METMVNTLANFISNQNSYLMLTIANLGVIIGLVLFSKSEDLKTLNNCLSFLISSSLMLGSASLIALTITKSNFLTGIEIGFGCLLVIALILGSKFYSTVECIGTVAYNTLEIGYPALMEKAKAIKVICEENTLRTRFVSFKKGAVLDAVLATENPEKFQIGEKVKFRAVLREGLAFPMWPAPGMPYFETRTRGGYIKPLANE